MIHKYYQIDEISFNKFSVILLHGKNDGLKKETILKLIDNKDLILNYEEKEILDNQESFIESIASKSLFENRRYIIIKRASEKILNTIEKIKYENLEDTKIIISTEILEKRSRLRTFFEKHKIFTSIAFFPDNEQVLTKLAFNFLKEKDIPISQSNINLIVGKCSNNRETLLNELNKLAEDRYFQISLLVFSWGSKIKFGLVM